MGPCHRTLAVPSPQAAGLSFVGHEQLPSTCPGGPSCQEAGEASKLSVSGLLEASRVICSISACHSL